MEDQPKLLKGLMSAFIIEAVGIMVLIGLYKIFMYKFQ